MVISQLLRVECVERVPSGKSQTQPSDRSLRVFPVITRSLEEAAFGN